MRVVGAGDGVFLSGLGLRMSGFRGLLSYLGSSQDIKTQVRDTSSASPVRLAAAERQRPGYDQARTLSAGAFKRGQVFF